MGVWLESVLAESWQRHLLSNDVEQGCIIKSTCIKAAQDCHVLQRNQKQASPSLRVFLKEVLHQNWVKHSSNLCAGHSFHLRTFFTKITSQSKVDIILLYRIFGNIKTVYAIYGPSQARKKTYQTFP
jgi:hypothetical protein